LLRRGRYWQYARLVREVVGNALIGYWPLRETSGAVANDHSNERNQGAYTNVTLGGAGMGDGHAAAAFNGTTSFCNIYSAGLNADMDKTEGAFGLFFKASGAGVWTDGVSRNLFGLAANLSTDFINIRKTTTNNTLEYAYRAGNTLEASVLTISSLLWNHVGITWSKSNERVRYYLNGALLETDTNLGVWSGVLLSTACCIGSRTTVPANIWSGSLAHAILANRELSGQEMLRLSRA
jgi:hypothetical protein